MDWAGLHGHQHSRTPNSLLIAPMPIASTAQILGNNECFEPFTSTSTSDVSWRGNSQS